MDDLISRKAAIDFIDAGHLCNPNEPRWSDNEVVNFLKSRPSAQPELGKNSPSEQHKMDKLGVKAEETCTDTISRQAAIDVADAIWATTGDKNVAKVWDMLRNLPSAQPDVPDTNVGDMISRQAAIDAPEKLIKDCNPDHFVGHQKFIEFMDDAEIGSFGNWQFANGFNLGLTAAEVEIKKLPSAQTEQRWIPIKWHDCTDEDREKYGFSNDIVAVFDCEMPDDDQPILVTTSHGYVNQDVCYIDDGFSLDSGWDWIDDIKAWMPLPKPYGGESDD